jgi:anthranilate synthase component 1
MRLAFCHSLKLKTSFRLNIAVQNIVSYKFSKEEGFSNLQMHPKFTQCVFTALLPVTFSNWYYLEVARFKGDEFNVYRALRRPQPSPYLFFS